MDIDKIKIFVEKFKMFTVGLLVLLAVFLFLEYKLVKSLKSTIRVYRTYSVTKAELKEQKQILEDLNKKEQEKRKEQENMGQLKSFYKPIGQAIDTESVIANEFSEVLELMKAHSVKIYSIQYTYDPQDDNFVKNLPDKFNVAQLNMQMVASYNNFKALLKEIYKHEHFIDIVSIDIHPYENNKSILVIDLVLKLYSQRD